MTRSPIQHEFVTKKYVDDGFNGLHEQIDSVEKKLGDRIEGLKSYLDNGFKHVFNQLDAVESNLGDKIDGLTTKVDLIEINLQHLTKTVNTIASQVLSLVRAKL